MKTKVLLIALCTLAAAGCAGTRGSVASLPADGLPTPLEEYRRSLDALKLQQQQNDSLRANLARNGYEIADLHARLAEETRIRQEAELALQAAAIELQTSPASRRLVDELQTSLDQAKTELASAKDELKARREELLKLILEQQKWNKYVLDKIKNRPAISGL